MTDLITTPKYKAVLSPPSDTDPPTNEVWSQDNLIGISPQSGVRNLFLTPYNFGAAGDGIVDDYEALQAWLDAIQGTAGYLPTGTYMTSATLTIGSQTTIYGAGKRNAVITTQQGVPQNYELLYNKHFVFPGDENWIDKDIAIYGVGFQGSSSIVVSGFKEFVVFIGVDGLIVRDCLFQHRRAGLFDLSNNNNVTVDNNEFYDWGAIPGPGFVPGAGQFAGGMGIFCLTPNFHVRITNNYLHDAPAGGGIWLPTTDTHVPYNPEGGFCICTGNDILFVVEAGIVGFPDGCVCTGNNIFGVTRVDVSGHGLEAHGIDWIFNNNTVQLCAYNCAYVSNSRNFSIQGNLFNEPNQEGKVGVGAAALSIAAVSDALSHQGDFAPTRGIISGNVFPPPYPKPTSAIVFFNTSGDAARVMDHMQVTNNNFGDPAGWLEGTITFFGNPDNIIGTDFIHRDNNGDRDCDPTAVNFIIQSGSNGDLEIHGMPYRPRRIEFNAVVPSNALAAQSYGNAMWTYGWDIATQTITTPAGNFESFANAWAANLSAVVSENTAGIAVINILDGDGTILCRAGVTQILNDGFVLSISSGPTTADAVVNCICYP